MNLPPSFFFLPSFFFSGVNLPRLWKAERSNPVWYATWKKSTEATGLNLSGSRANRAASNLWGPPRLLLQDARGDEGGGARPGEVLDEVELAHAPLPLAELVEVERHALGPDLLVPRHRAPVAGHEVVQGPAHVLVRHGHAVPGVREEGEQLPRLLRVLPGVLCAGSSVYI